jgi:hypothetical protein
MTIARLAYLTSPGPDRYLLNIQRFGSDDIEQIEISEGHLGNIVADAAHYAFRKHSRLLKEKADI